MPVLDRLAGLPLKNYRPNTKLAKPHLMGYRLVNHYDEGPSIEECLEAFTQEPNLPQLEVLSVGWWDAWDTDFTSERFRDSLLAVAPQMTSLRALFWCDISYDENEISWIENCSIAPLIQALPSLEYLGARGANGLSLGDNLEHNNLKHLEIQSGGLDRTQILEVANAKLPNLERLEIWLGSSSYGFYASIEDIEPFIHGSGYPNFDPLFPKLKHLGLMNCELGDAICASLQGAPILDQIEHLDLSMSILTDLGAQSLLDNPRIQNLSSLNLAECWIESQDLLDKLQALPIQVHTGGQQSSQYGPYVSVGE